MHFQAGGVQALLSSTVLGSMLWLASCASSNPNGLVVATSDGGDAGRTDGAAVTTETEPHDAATAKDAGDASVCTTLVPATAVAAEADPSEPPPATGGTIPDGTYHLTRPIFYRRSVAPTSTFGGTYRIQSDVFEYIGATAALGGVPKGAKQRMKTTSDGTHLELTACLCGGCYLGIGMEQPYSVVGTSLWLYTRDTDKGGGGDLLITVYERE